VRWCALLLVLTGCDALFGLAAIDPTDGGTDARPIDVAAIDGPSIDGALPADLAAWFPLEAVNNNKVADVAGGNDGACAPGHCPTAVAGIRAGALHFDGSTTVVIALPAPALDTPTSYTIAVWVFAENDGGTSYGCAVNKINGTTGDSWQFCTYGGQWNFFPGAFTTPVDYAAWHHLAATWELSTHELRIYVDGVLFGQPGTIDPGFDGGAVTIGADVDSGQQAYFYLGTLDDFRVYTRALDASEILALSQQ
jgi:hypothetical protein